ncbi:MAG: GMC oxidoreductase [Pirellulales bacterium]
MHVLVLEAGTAITAPPGSHLRNRPDVQSDPDGYFASVERHVAAPPELPGAFDATLLGGQGILWTNNCPRAPDFELPDVLSHEDWGRWYNDAETVLGVVQQPSADSRTGQNVCRRLVTKLGAAGRTIRGLPFSGRELASEKVYYNAPADIFAAASDNVRQRVTVQSNTTVEKLLHSGDHVTAIQVKGPDTTEAVLESPIIILCGGAIATPRLLHVSGIRSAALGRGFSCHSLLFAQIVLEESLAATNIEEDSAPRYWVPPTKHAPWHLQIMRDTCPLPSSEPVGNHHRLLEFQGFVPVESRDENAMQFSDDGQIRFRFSLSENDRQRMNELKADVEQLAAMLGRWRKGCEPTWVPNGSHLMGTCRMDSSRGPGVIDRKGRVHGFANLYVGTTGLLPTPISVNPTLTALALMLRICDGIVR